MSFGERSHSLTYAVRPGVVAKYLGQLLIAVGIITTVPFGVALLYAEYGSGLRHLAVVLLLLAVGTALARLPTPKQIQNNEALVVVALTFVLVPLVMAYPLAGQGIAFFDALFEAVSAITTTGLSTIGSVAGKEESFLFSRAWMQWYGGLGIVVLSVALLMGPGAATRRLARVGGEWKDPVTGTRIHAQRALSVYLVLTLTGVMLLRLTGLEWNDSLLHTLAGVSTGGFSNFDASMGAFSNGSSRAVLMLLAWAGAISLVLYHPAHYRGWRETSGHLELLGLLAASLASIGVLACCMLLVGGSPWESVLHNAPLVAISAQTGAGFSSLPVAQLDPASKLSLIVSMFIGGGVGSTAGGIKIIRLLILLRLLQLLIRRAGMPPHAVAEPRLGGRTLEGREIEHALLVILLFVMVTLLSWLAFLAYGRPALDSLFEVVSALGTVGLSTGIAAPELPPLLKGVLCLDMLLGRLEVVALLLVLYPRTWIGRKVD